MNASPDESGRNVDWPSPRAEQLPRFFDPESPGGGINCSTDLYVQAIMLGSRSKGKQEYQRENRDHGEGCIRKSIVLSNPSTIVVEYLRKYASRRMGGRIPLIPQNKLGWQQQQ
ncbi:hypothetical protein MGG_16517 [Pyricularia oryzae 70-15]|uniref:Uncharacterized protein n=2 Tax=Pyricularia oryzae TaxID=318829 RepID=G4MRU9_PYRO7|nr:uncharacterized protein MGG_16517 [Pyricularia oryzae 70-15]EHA58314.1 hypothetical protein MGG_16517 [Pyricularia oryzae 70-15]ELQ33002.1 hypothetical protein OOU_Y34scaffold01005g27 [Pyricularia oryzae Y34]